MHDFLVQHKNSITRFVSCIVMPVFFFSALFFTGMDEFNFSVMLSDPQYGTITKILSIPVMIHFLLPAYRKGMKRLPARIIQPETALCAVLLLCVIFIPYHEDASLLSSLHLLSAYSSLLLYNLILLQVYGHDPSYRTIYLPLCLLAVLLCLVSGIISGPAEAVYATAVCLLLYL